MVIYWFTTGLPVSGTPWLEKLSSKRLKSCYENSEYSEYD